MEKVGFVVYAVCPQRHPIHRLRRPPECRALGIMGANSLGPLGARRSIARAIDAFAPDLLIPCDDWAAAILHRLAGASHPRLGALLETSLGPACSYPQLQSKSAQAELAVELGIRAPAFAIVHDAASFHQALRRIGLPAFLKRDATWAGQGVAKIVDPATAEAAWQRLSEMHTWANALKRARREGWRHALAGVHAKRPAMHLQASVAGRPANRAVVCKDGEVLAGLTVLAEETISTSGPASVVRIIEHAEIAEATARLVRQVRASGFIGVDFILAASGESYFLEINARPTPASILSVAGADDLLGKLFQAMAGDEPVRRKAVATDLITLFPAELSRDVASPYLEAAYHDVPADEPGLVAFGLEQAQKDREAREYQE